MSAGRAMAVPRVKEGSRTSARERTPVAGRPPKEISVVAVWIMLISLQLFLIWIRAVDGLTSCVFDVCLDCTGCTDEILRVPSEFLSDEEASLEFFITVSQMVGDEDQGLVSRPRTADCRENRGVVKLHGYRVGGAVDVDERSNFFQKDSWVLHGMSDIDVRVCRGSVGARGVVKVDGFRRLDTCGIVTVDMWHGSRTEECFLPYFQDGGLGSNCCC